ncbi:YggS family pyridoxal phosphate-dependent enzyme [Halalkalibacillus sediminis]|uniref:Pyridoxal phosphate homeostasis protein n=1 Tax=Halalkalibacillus sediminis TaxID=2018042 RepID=A0A2I0QW50_9BACI|nr:YggS family pyridoxal phosphate-dependent enzyme [Halalkalibacillus sediminis]PKR78548.1 YggS family pyridoxal phosphate-dependent enzyme [Halalkalibacillus sediminis]
MTIEESYQDIVNKIDAACQRVDRNPAEVEIIAVTKYVSVATAQAAINVGVKHLAENRLEGFSKKYEEIGNEVNWHFVGTLQSRKVKEIINQVDYLHSLDRTSLAKEVNKRTEQTVRCFVQVNTSGEDSKHGLSPENVSEFIDSLEKFPKIQVVGLMTMAPFDAGEEDIRKYFKRLKGLRDKIKSNNWEHAPCEYLSMGMSNDFEIAVEEGATHVRIGTSLVGNEAE